MTGADHSEGTAHLRELDLEGLQDAQDSVDRPMPALQEPRPFDQIMGVQAVFDLHHIVEEPGVVPRWRLLHEPQKADAVEGRGPARKAHRCL